VSVSKCGILLLVYKKNYSTIDKMNYRTIDKTFHISLMYPSTYVYIHVGLPCLHISLFLLYSCHSIFIRAGTIRSAAVSIRNRYGPC